MTFSMILFAWRLLYSGESKVLHKIQILVDDWRVKYIKRFIKTLMRADDDDPTTYRHTSDGRHVLNYIKDTVISVIMS